MRIVLSIPQEFLDVLSSIGGIFYGNIKHKFVYAICTDSRECQDGDLFFALKGKHFDGNIFIKDIIKVGGIPIGPGVTTFGIKTESGNAALLDFTKFYKGRLPHLKYTVAITGSVGKTTTKEFLKILAQQRYKTHSTRENLNNEVGVPITVLSAPADTEVLICELGMNHSGEIKVLSDTVRPNIAIITKIGSAHIGNLGSIKNIARAKLEVTSGLNGWLSIPYDEPLLECDHKNIITHSAKNKNATYAAIKNGFGLLELYHNGELLEIIDYQFKGNHLYECLAAAACAAINMEVPQETIKDGIKEIKEDSFRHKIYQSPNGFYILDDSYNASYDSVIAAIDLLNTVDSYSQKNVLLGDILELGDKSEEIHKTIGKAIAEYNFDNLFIIGNFAHHIEKGALEKGFPKKRIFVNRDIHSPETTSSVILQNVKPNGILLIKASHKMNMERIINLIMGK